MSLRALDMGARSAIACQRCGKCCLVDPNTFITAEDIQRLKSEGREDILRVIEHEEAVWCGDHMVSITSGRYLYSCPFLEWQGRLATCTIYESRPKVCREYRPGSSEICPLYHTPSDPQARP